MQTSGQGTQDYFLTRYKRIFGESLYLGFFPTYACMIILSIRIGIHMLSLRRRRGEALAKQTTSYTISMEHDVQLPDNKQLQLHGMDHDSMSHANYQESSSGN